MALPELRFMTSVFFKIFSTDLVATLSNKNYIHMKLICNSDLCSLVPEVCLPMQVLAVVGSCLNIGYCKMTCRGWSHVEFRLR